MVTIANKDIMQHDTFYDQSFSELKLEKQVLKHKVFENCKFQHSDFKEMQCTHCKFIDCDYIACDLSLIKIDGSSFNQVSFNECKLIGINWTEAKWPYIQLQSPIKFYKSNISYSSFYELKLTYIVIEECCAKEVDFREGDFTNGHFTATDFHGSLFMHTKLYAADFTDAINYHINPNENDIRKGKYSTPDVINLLYEYDLHII